MSSLACGSGVSCTRWVVLAGMLASAVAAFVLVSRLRQAGGADAETSDDIYGM